MIAYWDVLILKFKLKLFIIILIKDRKFIKNVVHSIGNYKIYFRFLLHFTFITVLHKTAIMLVRL
jgi:hypothetical protein